MEVVDKIMADAKPLDEMGSLNFDDQPIIESISIEEEKVE